MKHIATIENCVEHKLLGLNYLFERNQIVFINNLEFKKCSINHISINNSILYFNKNEMLFEIQKGNHLISKFLIKNAESLKIVSENILEFYKRISRKELNYVFYNFNYEKLWENTGDEIIDIISNKYVKIRNRLEVDINSFIVRDIRNGKPLCSYSLPKGFKIYLKIEHVRNILYFTAYNEHQKNQLVTGLDIETGEVIWQHQYEVTSANKFISAPAFNEKNQLFYGIGHIYQVFNPKTGEIVLEKIFDESKNYNLLVDAQAIYDNKLWFVSGGGRNTKFGYVNIDTHKLEFLQDLPHEEYEVFDTPVFHEGKLYLRGKHQNNLYVFE